MAETDGLSGQWVGRFEGTSNGELVVNIDELDQNYRGVAYVTDDDRQLPGSAAQFSTANKEFRFQFRTEQILAVDKNGHLVAWDDLKSKYPKEIQFSKHADVTGNCGREYLSLEWTTDLGVIGRARLPRTRAAAPSDLLPMVLSWGDYKAYVSTLTSRRFLYRGQNERWRLRTSFHRSGRAEIHRYVNEDIPALHRHLSARTKHVFNLQIPDENGAFFNLVQHHGYPTPLLDWTYSPYVAAFFAFRGISNKSAAADPGRSVRVLIFDQEQWRKDWNQVRNVICPTLHVSIGEFIAIENERMIPQQAASTITNADDIETYIRSKERDGKTYLRAMDLSVGERNKVMRELSYMGITAGSLFPGLDGACEELAEKNFGI